MELIETLRGASVRRGGVVDLGVIIMLMFIAGFSISSAIVLGLEMALMKKEIKLLRKKVEKSLVGELLDLPYATVEGTRFEKYIKSTVGLEVFAICADWVEKLSSFADVLGYEWVSGKAGWKKKKK